MNIEEQRKQVIRDVIRLLKHNPFTFEFEVKEKPKGIRIICEVTKEYLDEVMRRAEEQTTEVQQ